MKIKNEYGTQAVHCSSMYTLSNENNSSSHFWLPPFELLDEMND